MRYFAFAFTDKELDSFTIIDEPSFRDLLGEVSLSRSFDIFRTNHLSIYHSFVKEDSKIINAGVCEFDNNVTDAIVTIMGYFSSLEFKDGMMVQSET